MKCLVSACLVGENCKYNGGNNRSEKVLSFLSGKEWKAVCPEVLGGLPVPRTPVELVDGKAYDRDGRERDREFRDGARAALEIARTEKPDLVILQPRSPSCGKGMIYDGTFTSTLTAGHGIAAALLIENGFCVVTPDEL